MKKIIIAFVIVLAAIFGAAACTSDSTQERCCQSSTESDCCQESAQKIPDCCAGE